MRSVLIVDDEPALRLLYEAELRRAGFYTMLAADARQCLEYVATMDPDLVILDIRLPGMDGVEVLQRIRESNPQIPIILNTAYTGYQNNYLTWVADAHLIKSSDLTELLETVERLLPKQSEADCVIESFFGNEGNENKRTRHV